MPAPTTTDYFDMVTFVIFLLLFLLPFFVIVTKRYKRTGAIFGFKIFTTNLIQFEIGRNHYIFITTLKNQKLQEKLNNKHLLLLFFRYRLLVYVINILE